MGPPDDRPQQGHLVKTEKESQPSLASSLGEAHTAEGWLKNRKFNPLQKTHRDMKGPQTITSLQEKAVAGFGILFLES